MLSIPSIELLGLPQPDIAIPKVPKGLAVFELPAFDLQCSFVSSLPSCAPVASNVAVTFAL